MNTTQTRIHLGTLGGKTIQLQHTETWRGIHTLTVSMGAGNDAVYLASGSDGVLSVAERQLYESLKERSYSAVVDVVSSMI